MLWPLTLVLAIIGVSGTPWAIIERQQPSTSSQPVSSSRASTSSTSAVFSPVPTSDIDPRLPQPTATSQTGPYPTVSIYPSGSMVEIVGRRPTQTYETFQGIPFAQPPIDELRFSPPQPATYNSSSIQAGSFAPSCAQTVYSRHQTFQDLEGDYGSSEDCLYLNVVRPVGLNATSGLPVLVFLHGGNFYGGAASSYDGSIVGQIAGDMGTPFLQVTVAYRVGVLGWPLGQEATSTGAANLGLQDATLALEWVRDHISAFGGDASKVTAAGQSAGGAIISLLYLRPDINLFRSAILMSATPSLFNAGEAGSVDQAPWQAFVRYLNCTTAAGNDGGLSPASEMSCLRSRNTSQILQAQRVVMGEYGPYALFAPVVDGSTIPASPFEILQSGAFRSAPIITGAVKDEGTTFVLPNISLSEFETLIAEGNRSDDTVQTVLNLYPEDPAEGSPFGTGDDTFGFSSEFKRASAYFGDAYFQAPRRAFMSSLSYFGVNTSWGYLFEQPMPESLGIPPYIGTGHHSDTIWSFGRVLTPLYNYTVQDQTLSLSMIRYFVNFIHHSDPNPTTDTNGTATSPTPGFSVSNTTEWSVYSGNGNGTETNVLRLLGDDVGLMRDDFRQEAIGYFQENWREWRY